MTLVLIRKLHFLVALRSERYIFGISAIIGDTSIFRVVFVRERPLQAPIVEIAKERRV